MNLADITLAKPYWIVGPNSLSNITARCAHLRPDAKIVLHRDCPPDQAFLVDAEAITEMDLRTGEVRKPFA